VTPFNRALLNGGAVGHFWDPATRQGAAMLDRVINHQAQIIAYVDDYKMMIFTTAPMLLLLLLMRRSRPVAKPGPAEPID
jgi:MFS transporter, DHA2 family, multidrug resistance protein